MSSTDTRFVDEQAGTIDYRPLYRDDQDEYECEALNSAGHIISQGYLDVISMSPLECLEVLSVRNKDGTMYIYQEYPSRTSQWNCILKYEAFFPKMAEFTKTAKTIYYQLRNLHGI